jgi:hypothetical protein
VIFQQRSEADAWTIDQLRRKHRVEDTLGTKPAKIVQQAKIEIAPVHHEMFVQQSRPQSFELERSQCVDQEDIFADQKLQQTNPRAVMKHVIRFGIQRHLVDAIQGSEQRS